MYAMRMTRLGEPEDLQRVELADPVPDAGQVSLAVEAIGCNFADILLCRGKYQVKPELPFSPGAEVAGRIVAVGPGVQGLSPGQAVTAQLGHGGYASHVLASADRVQVIPEGMPFADAIALGVTYLTSYLALCDRGALAAGDTLLVHAAAGGVGLAAVQIGAALGARVIAGASSEDKLELARSHGAHAGVLTSAADWPEQVRALTGGKGADVIYESVGGEIFERSLKCIAWGGRLLVIGFSSGSIPEVKMNRVMLKHISLIGLNLGAYEREAKERLQQANTRLFELYRSGGIRPLIHARYPLAEAPAALAALGSRSTVGKLILQP